jgi:signal transduction histidine kinase
MRFVLAASALTILTIDPFEPNRLVDLTYAALGLYLIYSGILYLVMRHGVFAPLIVRWSHWVDMAWYGGLIALSRGTNSIFFFFFFFAILVAAFRQGFTTGLQVTGIATILVTTIGLAAAPEGVEFELNRFLLRPVYLLVLGYMVSYWGGFEIALKRRLALLKEVTRLSNPRFGVDHTVGQLIERLRSFYEADVCLLAALDTSSGEHRLHRAESGDQEGTPLATSLPAELGQLLLALPPEVAVIYDEAPIFRRLWHIGSRTDAYHVLTRERASVDEAACAALATKLDTSSFISVPLHYHDQLSGRLYLASRRQPAFDSSDADFLRQVFDQVMPVLENIRLVDRLASDAAEQERQRIARDLHDSIIQPYIGLQIGLSAIRRKLDAGNNIADDLERLHGLTSEGIDDLRKYVRGLKTSGEQESSLLASLRRYATRFAEATGIDVQVAAPSDMRLNDRLAAEEFQLIAEGLSNVRRHTQSTGAAVALARQNNRLVVRIENDGAPGTAPPTFIPRSIAERAAALGGRALVERQGSSGTRVVIEIPL